MRVLELETAALAGKDVYIYGTTIGGSVIFQALKKNGVTVKGFYDCSGKHDNYCGLPAASPEKVKKELGLIVIALTRSFQSACRSLEQLGIDTVYQCSELLGKYLADDFEFHPGDKLNVESFLRNYSFYATGFMKEQIVIPVLEVFITERCTLKCRDCSHLIPYYKKPVDYDISEIIHNLSNLLMVVNRISELMILGGEPLLHHDMSQLLYWASKCPEIGLLRIITNGTVIPGKDVLQCIKETGAELRFSDYGEHSKKVEEFTDICRKMDIPYIINDEKWIDMGDIKKHNYSSEKIKQIFQNCPFVFDHLLLKDRLFRCAHIAHLNNQEHIRTYEHDSVKVSDCNSKNMDEKKKEMQKLFCADYFEGCRYCNGVNKNNSEIEPAVQLDGDRRNHL